MVLPADSLIVLRASPIEAQVLLDALDPERAPTADDSALYASLRERLLLQLPPSWMLK